MPKYRVHIQEVHFNTYNVEADSAEEAAKLAANAAWDSSDKVEWVDGALEYDHTPGPQTCSVTNTETTEEEWIDLPRTE